jgi:hypothetical protein
MMFEIVYALCVFIFMWYEIYVLSHTREHIYRIKRLSVKRKFSGETSAISKIALKGCMIGIVNIFYAIWCILGIAFGDNWPMYLGFFLFSMYSMIVTTYLRLHNYYRFHYHYARFDAIVSLILLSILFLEHYNRMP